MNTYETQHYNSIDGLRTIAAFGVILMHVLANGGYILPIEVFTELIKGMTHFVKLFLVISGFGMCCGYYERFKSDNVDLEKFYSKRFQKCFPFFALLVLLEIIANFGKVSYYEVFSDLTLSFNFLPHHDITVVGVGWTLGVIFAFYCLFPFYIFLISTKRRAWFTLVICLGFNYCCCNYFLIDGKPDGTNILFCSVYFVAGGLIYLYRIEIKKIFSKRCISLSLCLLATVFWFILSTSEYSILFTIKTTIMFAIWLAYAISTEGKILSNRFTKCISAISLEIYLSHMMIYRIFEKAGLIFVGNNDAISYIYICIITIIFTIIFSVVAKWFLAKAGKILGDLVQTST